MIPGTRGTDKFACNLPGTFGVYMVGRGWSGGGGPRPTNILCPVGTLSRRDRPTLATMTASASATSDPARPAHGALPAVVEALTGEALSTIVDLVAYPVPDGDGRAVVVANHDGAVRLTADGGHKVLSGRDPVANTDPMAFLPYEAEVADPGPANARNAYPDPGRRLLSFFADPGRSPDLTVIHTPRHYFPDEGGHRGEHGSLDVIQSRAPFIVSGAGVRRGGLVHDHARTVDVGPTLLHAAGVAGERLRDAAGRALDGRARSDLVDAGGRYVIGILWDGGHCSDLLHLAASGELPGVARLLESGTALTGGAVAEFPSVTLCNHTSALTGVGPGRHGIIGNVFFDRSTGQQILANDETTWHRSSEWLRPEVSTVFELLAAAEPGARTACVNEAVDRGATYSTMQVIRELADPRGAGALNDAMPSAEASPYVENPAHLQDNYFRWATRVDDAGIDQLRQVWGMVAEAPRLTWWCQVVTDAGHHAGGPRSEIARASLRDSDRRLQAFLAHLDGLGVTDDVTFLLTADHGFEGADESVTGSWAPALAEVLEPLGVTFRDEGPGLVYLF